MSRIPDRDDLLGVDEPDRARDLVRAWLQAHLSPEWVRAVAESDVATIRRCREDLDRGMWWLTLAQAGLATPAWPLEHGGLGWNRACTGVVAALLREYQTPRSDNPIGMNMVAPTLLRWGTGEQQQRYLPGIARHTDVWCQLFSEPGAGSDLASLSCRAEQTDAGWRVTGQKVWTSLAHRAAFGLLLARTDPTMPKHAGISMFCLPMCQPGVTVRPLRQITGDAEFNEVFLDDAVVTRDDLIGELGQGWQLARHVLTHERVSDSGGGVLPGVLAGRTVTELLRRHAPVADGALRERLTDLWIDEQLIALTLLRDRQARRTGAPGVAGTVTKLLQLQQSQAVQELAVDLNGADGTAWTADDAWPRGNAWSYLRTRGRSIAGGTREITLSVLGERVLGLPREPDVDRNVPWNQTER